MYYSIVSFAQISRTFWDGTSRGTKYTIDYDKELGKPIKMVNYITNEITKKN